MKTLVIVTNKKTNRKSTFIAKAIYVTRKEVVIFSHLKIRHNFSIKEFDFKIVNVPI